MIHRLFFAFIILVAVFTAAGVIYLPHPIVARIAQLQDFFMIAIPILGFGALVKYLSGCPNSNCCGSCKNLSGCCCGSANCKRSV